MQVDRAGALGQPYGLGWWIHASAEAGQGTVLWDPGAFGSVAWIDPERGIGGFFAIDDYTTYIATEPTTFVLAELIPLVASVFDEAREATNSND